jgi:hypothetical protein
MRMAVKSFHVSLAGVLLFGAMNGHAASSTLMLGSQPWPRDGSGNYVEGTAWLEIQQDYHGSPMAVCVARSSGSDILDADAIRRLTTRKLPPLTEEGVPIGGYVVFHINFSIHEESEVQKERDMVFSAARLSCLPQPLAGSTKSEQRNELTITPEELGKSTGGYDVQHWPTTSTGILRQLDMQVSLLVGSDGHVYDVSLPVESHGEFFTRLAYDHLIALTFPSTGEQHKEAFTIKFCAAGGAPIITQTRLGHDPGTPLMEGMMADLPSGLPPEAASAPARYITIIQHNGGDLPSGTPWPRYKSVMPKGLPYADHYARFDSQVGVYVGADGKPMKVITTPYARPPFEQEFVNIANKQRFPSSHSAHWERLVIRLVPTDSWD